MPADKRKMWLRDEVQFYEPIEELDGNFETRLGNFQIFEIFIDFRRIQGENSQSVGAFIESS